MSTKNTIEQARLNDAIRLQAEILTRSTPHLTSANRKEIFETILKELTKSAKEHPESQKNFLSQYDEYCASKDRINWMNQEVYFTKQRRSR